MKAITPDRRSIILASGSPRRLELMRRIGFEPIVRVSSTEEVRGEDEPPVEYARRLALEKAQDVAADLDCDRRRWILAADTIVVHDDQVLEKPVDTDEAQAMLERLSGDRHEVITAFCLLWPAESDAAKDAVNYVDHVSAGVELRQLSAETITRYVATGEPMDKAGGYGIQDVGAVLVRRLEGSYFAVVGLPVCEVVESLEKLGGLRSYPFADRGQ